MLAAVHSAPTVSVPLGSAFAAGRGVVTVGRGEHNVLSVMRQAQEAGLALPDKLINMVSRQHARLEVVSGHLLLVDNNTVNGTYVNDRRMEPGSTRVLQDNDVVSFGGPIAIVLRNLSQPNPWVWEVKDLQQFLAAYVPPAQGLPPSASASPAAASGASPAAAAAAAPPREVYRFSPGPPPAAHAAHAAPAAQEVQPVEHPAVAGAAVEVQPAEEEAVTSPEPASGSTPASLPGSLLPPAGMTRSPPEQAAAAADAASDDSAALDLAGLEAYLATQQGSNQAAAAAASAAAGAAAPLPPGTMPVQGATQALPPGAMPVHGPTQAASHAAAQALPPGTMPVHGPTQPQAAAPAEQPDQPAAWQPAQAAGADVSSPCVQPAAALAPPAPPADPECIDLTADSPSPVSAPRQRAQQHAAGAAAAAGAAPAPSTALPAAAGPAGAAGLAAMARAAAAGADYVDLASPTKRRHGVAQQEEQEAKRARPSPEARLQDHAGPPGAQAAAEEAAGGGSPPAPLAAAAAAGAGAGSSAATPDLSSMHQELMCAICQEMLVAAHNMYPCNHAFCGECLAGWLGKGRRECPNCRVKGTAAPGRNHQIDNIVNMFAKSLPTDDQAERQQKQDSWAANKDRLERELAAPWQRGGGGGVRERPGSGGGRAGGPGDGHLFGLAAALLGGGMPLAHFGVPYFMGGGGGGGGGQEGGGGVMPALPAHVQQQYAAGPTGRQRRGAAHPHRAPPPAPPHHEFKVEVAPQLSTARCGACSAAIGENVTRVGMRQAGGGRHGLGADGGYRWFHLACMPAAFWREAATEGVANLRHVPARDQAFVRERMRPPR